MNLVRLRYMEVPCFMQVSSVTACLEYSMGLEAQAQWGEGRLLHPVFQEISQSSGERKLYREPHHQLFPTGGEKFVSPLLTDITPQRFWFLPRLGREIDLVLDLLVRKLGPLQNPDPSEYQEPQSLELERKFQEFPACFGNI